MHTTPRTVASVLSLAALAAGASAQTFMLSDEKLHDDPTVLWDGFLTGQEGFDQFYEPVGAPLYFESALVETHAKFIYLHHEFPSNFALGSDVKLDVFALQVRLALTDRLAFIATQDGYSMLDNVGGSGSPEGWNDVAAGLKYVLISQPEDEFALTVGARYKFDSGDNDVLQGGVDELSPFISFAKGFDGLNVMGNLTYRLPFDGNDGNQILQWHLHADYELFDGFAPMVELHGIHYLDDASRTGLSVGGLDYTNLGSTDVAGSTVVWAGVGAGIKLTPHAELGVTYEFSLTNPSVDIMDSRVTAAATFSW